MGLTQEQYEATPGLTVDWDLEFEAVERRVEKILNDRANK